MALPKWDIGVLSARELEVLRTALQTFVQARSSVFTDSERSVARDLDERCLLATRCEVIEVPGL